MRNQLLRDADWAGMAHSVEIRVPYVDPFFLAALPAGSMLAAANAKAAVADIPEPPLPAASRVRRKTGFVTPVGRWLREAAGVRDGKADLSIASRDWALRVWRAGWAGPAAP
jgi:asparagine synthase (glutamine-hydrolysing)